MKAIIVRILSVVTAIILLVSTATATERIDVKSTTLAISTIQSIAANLSSVALAREDFGLDDVDFSKLSIGCEIPAYEVVNGEILSLDIHYYPIYAADEVVALALTTANKQGQTGSTITVEFVDVLAYYVENEIAIALVYDQTGVSVVSSGEGDEREVLATYAEPMMERTEFAGIGNELVSVLTLAVATKSTDLSVSLSQPYTEVIAHNCPIDVVMQGDNSKICWACVSVSIGNYLVDENVFGTGSALCKAMYGSEEYDGGIDAFKSALSTYYDTTSTRTIDAESLAPSTILNELIDHHPMYGSFYRVDDYDVKHAAAIKGVNVSNETFTVMDPEVTSYKYISGTYTTSTYGGDYTYSSAREGKTLQLEKVCIPQ